jgi:hypothetical protein
MTVGAAQKAVYDPYAKSETEFDYKPLSNTMEIPFSADEVITLRGCTEITPEIVGGNKKVFYSYNIVNEYHHKNENGEYVPKTISGTNTQPLYSEPETGNDESGGINYAYKIMDRLHEECMIFIDEYVTNPEIKKSITAYLDYVSERSF